MVVQKSGRKIASALKRKPKAQKTTTHKHVTLKAHHAKPYRKRHVGLLLLCVAALIVIGFILVKYRDQILRGEASSKDFISDIFGEPTNKNQAYNATVESSYGFSISYDQREFYASAINGATGKLALGAELNGNKPFTVIRLAPQYDTDSNEALGTALTITYHTDKSTDDDPLEAIALQDGSLDAANLSRVKNEDYTIDGKNFTKITWQSKLASNVAANLKTNFVTYTGIVDGHAITVVLSLGTDKTSSGMFDAVVSNIKFGGSSASLPSGKTAANTQKAHDLLDIVTNAQFAEAANKSGEASLSEKTAALYSSAVIKVYHAYCMDIYVNDTPFLGDACQAASGSGFIVSQNGYIGTNGHVAAITVKELAIYGAILQYYSKGDSRYLAYLLNLTTLTNSDLAGKDSKQTASVLVDAFYDIPDSNFKAANDVDNILVNLSADEIDTTAFLEATYARQSYTEKKAVSAELVGSNYRLLDGYDGWRASDVALLKISGQNFPIVKLGSLDTLQQGADISILGYPGAASSNGLVESSVSEATLTTGKVSAKKKASGSNNMLVETDTTIGHGNSGGPAFNGDGEVIGIATYTIDGSGAGNGVYNYIRDIKDFKTLASSNNVKFDTNSETQTEWNEGINNFYASHYSKAVKNFEKVKELYPNHAKADEFIAAAEKRIANGEDVVDFPWLLVTVIAGVVLIGAVATVVVIVAHGKHHKVYQAGVAQGAVQPLQPGAPAQTVMVSQPVVQPAGSVPSSTFGQQPPQPTIQPFSPEPITPTTLEPSMPAPTAPPQASAQSTTPASNYYPQSNPGNLAQ